MIIFHLSSFLSRFRAEYIKTTLGYCGKDVYFYGNVDLVFPEKISIDDSSHIGTGVQLRGGGLIKIGKWCQIAIGNIITSGGHPIDGGLYHNRVVFGDIIISDNVWIGAGVIILPNVSIGINSVVAAGAVVTRNVPSNTIVAGVPARVIGQVPHSSPVDRTI